MRYSKRVFSHAYAPLPFYPSYGFLIKGLVKVLQAKGLRLTRLHTTHKLIIEIPWESETDYCRTASIISLSTARNLKVWLFFSIFVGKYT